MVDLGLSPLVVAFLGTASAAVATTEDTEGKIVQAIHWQGLQTVLEETAVFYLGIEVDKPLDLEALNQGIHALWESRLFENIEVRAEPTATGVELWIQVQERPVLSSLEFEALGGISRHELEERIARKGLRVDLQLPVARGELERLRQELQALLRERGSRFSAVSYRLEPSGPSEVRAVFKVTAPDRIRVEDILFRGNTAFSQRRLRWAMKRTKESGLLTRLLRMDAYDPAQLDEDLGSIRTLYRDHGYKDVDIGEPQVEIRSPASAGGRPVEGPRSFLTIFIEEGERWSLSGLSVEGNRAFSDERLLHAYAGLHGGWLQQSAVDAWEEAIRELYLGEGRLDTRITTELRERTGRMVDVVAHVREGEQFRIGRLEFEGNTRTREGVLRRELSVDEGEVLDLGALRSSLLKIRQLGLFNLDEEPIELRNFDAQDGTVDVVLKGKEKKPLDVRFGGGWSEVDGFSTHLVLDTPNFLGRGHRAALRLETGGTREGVELAYSVPWIFNRPHTVGVELFDWESDYSLSEGQRFFRDEVGATLTWGRFFGPRQLFRTSYTYASLDDLQTGRDPGSQEIRSELSRRKSSVRSLWVYDRRDHPLDPTAGLHAAASLEVAGGLLGGSDRFSKSELSFSWFRPTPPASSAVLAFNLQAGWVEARHDEALSPLETFFLGGTQSLRGFATRSISARGDDDELLRDELGFLVGGTRFLEIKLELHLPLGGPFEAVLFADAGNVFPDGQSFDLTRLRTTAGAELQLRVPPAGIPLRLIFASNLDPLPGDRFDSFQFSFGTSF